MLIVRALSQTSLRASRGQPEHKFPHQAEKKSKVLSSGYDSTGTDALCLHLIRDNTAPLEGAF